MKRYPNPRYNNTDIQRNIPVYRPHLPPRPLSTPRPSGYPYDYVYDYDHDNRIQESGVRTFAAQRNSLSEDDLSANGSFRTSSPAYDYDSGRSSTQSQTQSQTPSHSQHQHRNQRHVQSESQAPHPQHGNGTFYEMSPPLPPSNDSQKPQSQHEGVCAAFPFEPDQNSSRSRRTAACDNLLSLESNLNDISPHCPPPPRWMNAQPVNCNLPPPEMPHFDMPAPRYDMPPPTPPFYNASLPPPNFTGTDRRQMQPSGISDRNAPSSDSNLNKFPMPPSHHDRTSSTVEMRESSSYSAPQTQPLCDSAQSFPGELRPASTNSATSLVESVGGASPSDAETSTTKEQDRRAADQDWVTGWTNRITHEKSRTGDNPRERSHCNIPEAREQLREAVVLSAELHQLASRFHDDPSAQDTIVTRIDIIKRRLAELKRLFGDEKLMTALERKVGRIARKRDWKRRRRASLYAERETETERREILHQRLDEWQDKLRQDAVQIKRDKELKASADSTLCEVRAKLADVKRATQLVETLTRLRQVRKSLADANGVALPRQSEYDFLDRKATLEKMLAKQKTIYDAEKKTLEVMLEMEKEGNEEREKEEAERRAVARRARLEKRILRSLFGREPGRLASSDPLASHQKYHEAGWHHLQHFITIRQDWDKLLVPPGTLGGSTVPANWVVPPEVSSDAWSVVLHE